MGAEFLSCWISDDFRNWTFDTLNWPTKTACTSPLSNENNVWAPSVIRKGDAFYMYISVGSEVWCGKANHPLGPWENMLGDQPMIPYDTTRFYHVIDAEAFIDDDGKVYLYWGSGWDWINGHCFAAELNDDMASFKSEPVEVTPTHYFEGPLMVKHNGKYYLTYSEGKTIDDTYEVRYAVGNNPLGPFTEAANSPVLKTDKDLEVYGPGHHTVFSYGGKDYILYHRHSLPFVSGTAMRQTCVAELDFDDNNSQIKTVTPNHTQLFPDITNSKIASVKPVDLIVSSEHSSYTRAKNVMDNNYTTRWEAVDDDDHAFITAVFENNTDINRLEIRFEYPWKNYFIKIDASDDGENWNTIADYTTNGISGSPVLIPVNKKCKYIRTIFENRVKEDKPSVWELCFYE
jgi:beta-xylosidase